MAIKLSFREISTNMMNLLLLQIRNLLIGDLIARPHSEAKPWTPPAAPPVAPQSAPPQLPEPEGEQTTLKVQVEESLTEAVPVPRQNGLPDPEPLFTAPEIVPAVGSQQL